MSKYSFLLFLHIAPFFILLLLLSQDVTIEARELGTTRSLGSRAEDYVTMKPPLMDHRKQFFRRKEVKNCMPQGYRHSSAPSRYINYHTMGSSGCSSTTTTSNNNRKLP